MKFIVPIFALLAGAAVGSTPPAAENRDFIADLKVLLKELPPSDDADFHVEMRDLFEDYLDPASVPFSGMSTSAPTAHPAAHQNAPRCVNAYIPDPNDPDGDGEPGEGDNEANTTAGPPYSVFAMCVCLAYALLVL